MYFHNGDHQPKLIFQRNECLYENIYVSELREGYIKSELPYFVTSSDGHLSIATQRYSFDYYDNNHNYLKTFELAFTECEEQVTEKSVLNEENFSLTHFTGVIVLLIMYSLILIIQRRTHD